MNTNTMFHIPGPMGALEAIYTPAAEGKPILAIICHPHPLHGGTMHNKVITTLAKVCELLNIASLRFNYRGVQGSAGTYGEIEGEVEDLDAVVAWAKAQHPDHTLWLMGFSFGSYIASRGAITHQAQCLVCVAPAVQHAHFDTLPPIPCPWFIVQGDQDEVVPAALVYAFADSRAEHPTVLRFPEAGHFFHRLLIPLREQLLTELETLV